MSKKKQPSAMTLYGIAVGLVLFGGTIVSMKSTLFPEPLASCSQRYGGGLNFPDQTTSAQPVSIRDVQTKLGFDEWGLVEHVSLSPLTTGPYALALKVELPKGASGDKNAVRKGGVSFIWKPGIQGGASSACLSYAVRLADSFEFGEGGTLPGLFGGDEPRGGSSGFASRMMWRHNGAGDVLMNIPSSGERGVTLANSTWRLPKGTWINIEQEVRLNTPGRADGFLGIWVDGVLHTEMKQMAFRTRDAVRISGVLSDVHYNAPAPNDTSLQITNFNLRWK